MTNLWCNPRPVNELSCQLHSQSWKRLPTRNSFIHGPLMTICQGRTQSWRRLTTCWADPRPGRTSTRPRKSAPSASTPGHTLCKYRLAVEQCSVLNDLTVNKRRYGRTNKIICFMVISTSNCNMHLSWWQIANFFYVVIKHLIIHAFWHSK